MRQVRWASWMVGLAVALALCGVRPAVADVRSDKAAAIILWPNVLYFEDEIPFETDFRLDTVIQLSNTSTESVHVHCFWENANAHCSNTGEVCFFAQDCFDPSFGSGICVPGWNETDFHIQLTPRQPLGWLASQGMAGFATAGPPPPLPLGTFPLGRAVFGPGGASNSGSRIPGVPEEPFTGSLRCIAVNPDGIPVDRNVLKGEATLTLFATSEETESEEDVISVAKHNAIGIQAVPGQVNDDNVLVLGGDEPEYNGCPNVLILNHFFDGGQNPVTDDGSYVLTALTLVPCTQNFLRQIPGANVVQYLVFNEFEQRFSTSRTIQCKDTRLLSNTDTTQNTRSIFSVGVAQTLTGQTRINPISTGSGMLAVATEIHVPDSGDQFIVPIADTNVHYQGDRENPDLIILP